MIKDIRSRGPTMSMWWRPILVVMVERDGAWGRALSVLWSSTRVGAVLGEIQNRKGINWVRNAVIIGGIEQLGQHCIINTNAQR